MKRLNTHVTGAFGSKIHVGDLVTYPGRQSSSVWLNCGVVSKITMKPHPWRKDEDAPVLTIIRISQNMGWRDDKEFLISASLRRTHVTCVDRVVPIDINTVDLDGKAQEMLLQAYSLVQLSLDHPFYKNPSS